MKKLLTIIFILIFAVCAVSQTVEANLQECSQFLQKSVTEANACKKANADKAELIEAQKTQIAVLKQTLETQEKFYSNYTQKLEKLVERLEAVKCTRSSFLIFVYRSKTCY